MASSVPGIGARSAGVVAEGQAEDLRRTPSPTPRGMGAMGDSIASSPTTCSTGETPRKRSRADSPSDTARTDVASEVIPAAAAAAILPLPALTADHKSSFYTIYRTMATGKIKEMLDIPVSGWGAFRWATFDWVTFTREVRLVKSEGEKVKDMHPLSFLAWVGQEETMKTHLRTIKHQGSYIDAWNARIGKISSALSAVGVDASAPWTRTVKDFTDDMNTHIRQNTLQMEAFLVAIPEGQRETARGHIEGLRFEALLHTIIG